MWAHLFNTDLEQEYYVKLELEKNKAITVNGVCREIENY